MKRKFFTLLLLSVFSLQISCYSQDAKLFNYGAGVRMGIPYTVLDVTNNPGVGVELQREVQIGSGVTVPLSVGYLVFPKKPANDS